MQIVGKIISSGRFLCAVLLTSKVYTHQQNFRTTVPFTLIITFLQIFWNFWRLKVFITGSIIGVKVRWSGIVIEQAVLILNENKSQMLLCH